MSPSCTRGVRWLGFGYFCVPFRWKKKSFVFEPTIGITIVDALNGLVTMRITDFHTKFSGLTIKVHKDTNKKTK